MGFCTCYYSLSLPNCPSIHKYGNKKGNENTGNCPPSPILFLDTSQLVYPHRENGGGHNYLNLNIEAVWKIQLRNAALIVLFTLQR